MKFRFEGDSSELVEQFLAGGGSVVRCPTKMAQGSDGREFTHTRQMVKDRKAGRA